MNKEWINLFYLEYFKTVHRSPGEVTHTYNPSYLGGRALKNFSFRLVWAKSS
jgi:hypothetical protein